MVDDSIYRDYHLIRNLLQRYASLKSSTYSENVSDDTDETLIFIMDMERALRGLTLYEREIVFCNCIFGVPAHELSKKYSMEQPKMSSDIVSALKKMSVILVGGLD